MELPLAERQRAVRFYEWSKQEWTLEVLHQYSRLSLVPNPEMKAYLDFARQADPKLRDSLALALLKAANRVGSILLNEGLSPEDHAILRAEGAGELYDRSAYKKAFPAQSPVMKDFRAQLLKTFKRELNPFDVDIHSAETHSFWISIPHTDWVMRVDTDSGHTHRRALSIICHLRRQDQLDGRFLGEPLAALAYEGTVATPSHFSGRSFSVLGWLPTPVLSQYWHIMPDNHEYVTSTISQLLVALLPQLTSLLEGLNIND